MKIGLTECGHAAIAAAVSAVLVLGSAGPGFAKKKKEEAPPPTQITCWFTPTSPVCGDKGGERVTYKNSCYAEKDGAKVVSTKACPVPKQKHATAKPAKKKM